jgi:CcmD family protein
MNKFFSTLALCFFSLFCFAQNTTTESSMDVMKSNGKIYVVVAVVLIILIGLFFYVWRLDKKITTLEQNKNA